LKTYKSSSTEATDALQGLRLNEDEFEEEYDFMDESGDETNQPRRIDPKLKYMRLLQNVADRVTAQITIDLDDLDTVCYGVASYSSA
jgi:DNA replication licensing factor MCM7